MKKITKKLDAAVKEVLDITLTELVEDNNIMKRDIALLKSELKKFMEKNNKLNSIENMLRVSRECLPLMEMK